MLIKSHKNHKQAGSIILYTVLIMATVMMISISLMRILLPKVKVTSEAINSVIAIYAADSGMELCIISSRINSLPIPSLAQLNNSYMIPGVTIQSYPNPCPYSPIGSVSARTVGTYRGISRSLEVF